MTSQPDKLFSNKLENFQRPAPVAAWERIEAGLDKTNSKVRWMKIAAGLLLLSVAAFILWPATVSKKTELAKIKEVAPKINEAQSNTTTINEAKPSVTSEQNATQKISMPNEKITKKSDPILIAEKIETKTDPIIESTESTPTVLVAEVTEKKSNEIPSRTIVYSAEEVNSKYLRKKSPTEATPEVKKSSGIQKLMGLAYNLKNTDNGLGDLRQKKDEILALNFLNEDKTKKEKN